MIPASCGSPGREPRNPAQDVGPEILVLRSNLRTSAGSSYPDKRVEGGHTNTPYPRRRWSPNKAAAQNDGDKGNVNRIAHGDRDPLSRGSASVRSAPACPILAAQSVQTSRQARVDRRRSTGSRRHASRRDRRRRPKLPTRNPPGTSPPPSWAQPRERQSPIPRSFSAAPPSRPVTRLMQPRPVNAFNGSRRWPYQKSGDHHSSIGGSRTPWAAVEQI